MYYYRLHIFLCFALLISFSATAQQASQFEKQADAKLSSYAFDEASILYKRAHDVSNDSSFKTRMLEKITQCDNGMQMLSFACEPIVVASKKVPRNSFYQYYSHIEHDRWAKLSSGEIVSFSPDMKTLFFSQDNLGQRDIYTSTKINDTLWSTPTLMGNVFLSSKDEIMPLISFDGEKLYYSSQGLFGMGGYDMFVSEWDENSNSWGEPQNMGFPFSSVGDDFLFSDTPDGNYSIFASNRDCSKDSVIIYVLEFNNTPLKSSLSASQAQRIGALEPQPQQEAKDQSALYDSSTPSNSSLTAYQASLSEYWAIKDSIFSAMQKQNETRRRLSSTVNDADSKLLERKIASSEVQIFELQHRMGQASANLQQAELTLLAQGIVPNSEPKPAKHPISQSPQHSRPDNPFTKIESPKVADLIFEEPQETFDYSFRVLDEAIFAESNELPSGIIYQIQILSSTRPATLKQLKGLSPVFEKKQSPSKYIYCVGRFSKYYEAQTALKTVKKRGFSSAFVVAFNNGKSLSLANARKVEASAANSARFQLVFTDYPDGIPAPILEVIRASCSKDIARRSSDNGEIIYYIAPFDDKNEAEALLAKLLAVGVQGASIETI